MMLKANLDEKEMRTYLIEKIQQLDKTKLTEIYQLISKSFAEDLINMVAEAEGTGKTNRNSTEELIQQYRKRNPYQ